MNIVTIDEPFIVHQLNVLPPHSRKRAGYCDMLRHIRRQQLEQERLGKVLESELEKALSDVPRWQIERMQESF